MVLAHFALPVCMQLYSRMREKRRRNDFFEVMDLSEKINFGVGTVFVTTKITITTFLKKSLLQKPTKMLQSRRSLCAMGLLFGLYCRF